MAIDMDLVEEVLTEMDLVFDSRDKTWEILLCRFLEIILQGQVDRHCLQANKKPNDLFRLWITFQKAKRGEQGYEVEGLPEQGDNIEIEFPMDIEPERNPTPDDLVYNVADFAAEEYLPASGGDLQDARTMLLSILLRNYIITRLGSAFASPMIVDVATQSQEVLFDFYTKYLRAERGQDGFRLHRQADGLIISMESPAGWELPGKTIKKGTEIPFTDTGKGRKKQPKAKKELAPRPKAKKKDESPARVRDCQKVAVNK